MLIPAFNNVPADFVIDEPLELLRDKLRQAAVHSPSERTREAAADALEKPFDLRLIRLVQAATCSYAPELRMFIAHYWRSQQ